MKQFIIFLARAVCTHCGAPGTIYADDHETILCGRCWLLAHGTVPNDESRP